LRVMKADGTPKTVAAAGDVLHLRQSRILGRHQDLRQVYVRQSYVDLVGIVIGLAARLAPKHEDATARAQVLVRGTPGIGNGSIQPRLHRHSS
jgi:hypothetical protein